MAIVTRKLKESEAATKVIKALKLVGFAANKIVASEEQASGLPDVIACSAQGHFIAIEMKIIIAQQHVFDYTNKQLNRLKIYNSMGALALGVAVLAYEHNISVVDTNLDAYGDEILENWQSFAFYIKQLAEQKSSLPK